MSKKKALYITEALSVALIKFFDHSGLENVAIVCERCVPISSSFTASLVGMLRNWKIPTFMYQARFQTSERKHVMMMMMMMI
jgi:hypothetical protein